MTLRLRQPVTRWLAASTTACVMLLLVAACSRGGAGYSGTLQAEAANVGSTVGGRVLAVLVSDGQVVHKGQVLVSFDPKDQRAVLNQAQGALAQAQAALADLLAGARPEDIAKANAQAAQAQHIYEQTQITAPHQITEAQAQVHQAAAAAADAAANAARAQALYADGYTSAQQRDAAVTADRQAQAQLRSAQAQLAAVQSGSAPQGVEAARQAYAAAAANAALVAAGARPDQIQQARAAVEAARAGVQAAQARLAEMTVRSPADGIVNGMNLHPGDLVPAGASVTTIDEFVDPYVRIYVPQSDLGKLHIGQAVTVISDAFPGRTFQGSIETIDQTAQFTPRDVQTAQDRANLVFGVKVRVHDPDRVLRGGTTAEVTL
jgi:HlyD family secretion protein